MESDSSEGYQKEAKHRRMRSKAVERRLSKKSSSKDRHGKIYPDTFGDHTVRAVTPETPPTTSSSAAAADTASSFSPTSPSSHSTHRSKLPHRRREHSASMSNTDEETTLEGRRRRNRARTHDGEETLLESSPNSFISKTRLRLGSITTSGSYAQKIQEDSVGSIGFPSIIQSPTLPGQKETRQRLATIPARISSPPAQASNNPRTFGGAQGGLMDPDTGKISSLMKITSGRMAGILFFRSSCSAPWASGYCAINVASGSLIFQPNVRNPAQARHLISDLRGCSVRTLYDAEAQGTYLKVSTASSELAVQLRPAVPETFDSWLAALLCWQPILPSNGEETTMAPSISSSIEPRRTGRRKASESTIQGSLSIIKMGKSLMWNGSRSIDRPRSAAQKRVSSYKQGPAVSSPWQQVNCTLHENGLLRLAAESDARPLSSIHLSQLSRYAVQQLDASVLDEDFCIAIHPQYAASSDLLPQSQSVILSFESRISFEVWFVLLRAFTVPELHDPEQPRRLPTSDRTAVGSTPRTSLHAGMFRVERSLLLRLIDARFRDPADARGAPETTRGTSSGPSPQDNIYAEILLDDLPKARTAVKPEIASAIWGESFHFTDLPNIPSDVTVLVKVQDPAEREWTMTSHGSYDLSQSDNSPAMISGHIEVSSHDKIYGKIKAPLRVSSHGQAAEKRWPIIDNRNVQVGDMLLRIQPTETLVLMTNDYTPLSHLLHNFPNNLTIQIAQMLHSELVPLSEILVDIFQVSGGVSDWLMYLVEDEIDGIGRELPFRRTRYSNRVQSNDSNEGGEHREILLRDLGRSATVEANLLFRGNSLLTKAFDAHMRRLGTDYLQETIGDRLRDIAESNPDCEVDPSKVRSQNNLDRNWRNLIALTSSIWNAISTSASRCPLELRLLFRHVQACAHDRYGDWIRSVKYSSVSGFLFLRFFCPAILNPKLFNLIKGKFVFITCFGSRRLTIHALDHPKARARRTFTLIAKSLQGLANMTTFGNKEPWMDPMNIFIGSSKAEFRNFIDQICSVPLKAATKAVSPSYATPIQMLGRLPATSREGFPSLPYLIDSAQRYANLVSLWLDHFPADHFENEAPDQHLRDFHDSCLEIQQRTGDAMNSPGSQHVSGGRLDRNKDLTVGEESTHLVTEFNGIPTRPSKPLTGTTAGSNGLRRANHTRNASFLDSPSPLDRQEAVGPADDDTTSSPGSIAFDQTRLPSSRLNMNDVQGSSTNSKSSSTISFHRPLMPRSRTSHGSQDAS
jgi:hypothetical protein